MEGTRDIKRRLKDLAAALKAEPGSIPKRLELAAALREAGRPVESIDLYRGVAEAYAEDGRLVQAMAVCKGILEMDPEHTDTLEMLATLAARREHGGRRASATLTNIDGRWVAEPTGEFELDAPEPPAEPDGDGEQEGEGELDLPFDDEQTPVGEADPSATPVPGGDEPDSQVTPIPSGDSDPGLTRIGTITAGRRRRQSSPAPAEPRARRDTPLDFPEETKARARGHRLLDLGPVAAPSGAGDHAAHEAPLEQLTPRVLDTDRMPTVTPEELEAAHAAAEGPGERLPPIRPELTFGDEDSAADLLHEVIDGPFPRPLPVEPPPFPLLSELPRAAFMDLLTRLSLLRLEAGEMVLHEGAAGDACYLVASGRVRVTKGGVALAELGPGAFFGEFAVLADQRRHASVQTLESTELLEIRRELIDELVAAHPGVARTLRTFYRERLLETLLATAPFFEQLSGEERAVIAERFRPRRFGRGAQIIEEGKPGGGLYLILVGEVEVVRAGKAKDGSATSVKLGTLGEGSYFGEMSLLRGGVASATVRATRMTEAVQLGPRDFYELASQHPILWEQLRTEAERRELANHAIVAGDARKSDTFYLV